MQIPEVHLFGEKALLTAKFIDMGWAVLNIPERVTVRSIRGDCFVEGVPEVTTLNDMSIVLSGARLFQPCEHDGGRGLDVFPIAPARVGIDTIELVLFEHRQR